MIDIHEIRIGDLVKVIKEVPSYSTGWDNSWEDEMTDLIGKIGYIIEIDFVANDILVRHFGSGEELRCDFGFPPEALEKFEGKVDENGNVIEMRNSAVDQIRKIAESVL